MNIGRYEVVQELGRGGMAIVYLARDPYIKRQVAVKVLPRQFTFDPQFRTRFQREAEVIATLEHGSIVPVYDYGEHEDQPFIVMRYMSGGTLADRLQQGALPISEVGILYQRIGSAVDYAHSMGIIHRDIKPGNILFDAQGEASLSDFGIAKITEATTSLTGTAMIGTPEYMSPEQAQGEKNLDGRCDIYSLGIVLFQALTGELPYKADTPMGVAMAHITKPIPSLLESRSDLPPRFETVIRKTLDKDPAKRYQTAGELARAITDPGAQPVDKTMLESAPGTVIEPMPIDGTMIEPISGSTPPPIPPEPVPAKSVTEAFPSVPPQPAAKKAAFPKLLGLGGVGLVALCLCIGLIGGFASGLIPNPLAPAVTPTPGIAQTLPSETPDLQSTVPATQFVPVGLSTTYIEYILDASGSMLQDLQGKTRLQVAREVLTSRLSALPANTQVGLRVYGHRVPYQGQEAQSCQDIELVVPIRANGAQDIIAFLPNMQALGMTPMSESIKEAANDFTFEPGRKNFIVLISDGAETCGEEPATVVQYLKEIGIDFAIHVIGLDVDPDTAAQLKRISDTAGGVYYDARSEADLDAALGNVNETMLQAPAESPTVVAQASATSIPEPNAEVASEGTVDATSIYDSTFPASLAVDGDLTTSWFSAGPEGDGTTAFVWTGVQDDFIASIELISNRENQVVDFRTGYGFGTVTIQVFSSDDLLVFEETVSLDGTPDPDIHVTPNVVGRWIWLMFTGSEALDCGGFAELKVGVVRSNSSQAPSTLSSEPSSPSFTAGTDMLCREGPSTSHVDRWQLRSGETVPVLARWHEDPNWLLVDINVPASETRTDCCWVGGEGTLNVPIDQIKSINHLPDRLDCSAVK
jgi:serine/threonine-protein kinase